MNGAGSSGKTGLLESAALARSGHQSHAPSSLLRAMNRHLLSQNFSLLRSNRKQTPTPSPTRFGACRGDWTNRGRAARRVLRWFPSLDPTVDPCRQSSSFTSWPHGPVCRGPLGEGGRAINTPGGALPILNLIQLDGPWCEGRLEFPICGFRDIAQGPAWLDWSCS